jgi:hypothetical protein
VTAWAWAVANGQTQFLKQNFGTILAAAMCLVASLQSSKFAMILATAICSATNLWHFKLSVSWLVSSDQFLADFGRQ